MTDLMDLEAGDRFDGPLLLTAVDQRETKNGDPYLAGRLRDETLELEIRWWDRESLPAEPGEVVRCVAEVTEYKGQRQLTVHRLHRHNGDASPADFVASAHRPAEELLDEVWLLVDRHCQPLLTNILGLVLVEHQRALTDAPAAKRIHHARHGGLIEHIHSMAWLACDLTEHYQLRYDRTPRLDLVLAGCILHDIGKLDELSGPIGTEYTREGSLGGHIAIGLQYLDRAAREADVSRSSDLYQHLRHLILSHHGKGEWGSPVEPKTPEAILLHQLDMMDSRLDPACSALSRAGEGEDVETSAGQELMVMGGGGCE